MAKKRNGRQDAIRDIVRNKDVRTQCVLVDELRAMGFDCTQATVSRDIADMGLRKLPEGIYVLAEGKIAESGTHEQLLEKDSIYKHMWSEYNKSVNWQVGKAGVSEC